MTSPHLDLSEYYTLLSVAAGLEYLTGLGIKELGYYVSVAGTELRESQAGVTTVTHKLSHLLPGARLVLIVAAVCDGACLQQTSKLIAPAASAGRQTNSLLSCAASTSSCQRVSTVYAPVLITAAPSSTSSNSESDGSYFNMKRVINFAVAVVVLVLLFLLIISKYYLHSQSLQEDFDFNAMEMTDFRDAAASGGSYSGTTLGSRRAVGSGLRVPKTIKTPQLFSYVPPDEYESVTQHGSGGKRKSNGSQTYSVLDDIEGRPDDEDDDVTINL